VTLGGLERWFSPRGQDLAFILSCIGLVRPSSSAQPKTKGPSVAIAPLYVFNHLTSGKTRSGAPVCRFRGGSLGFRTRKKEMARLHRHPARTFPPHLTYRLAAGPIQASLKTQHLQSTTRIPASLVTAQTRHQPQPSSPALPSGPQNNSPNKLHLGRDSLAAGIVASSFTVSGCGGKKQAPTHRYPYVAAW
jgi:hypothetical protein